MSCSNNSPTIATINNTAVLDEEELNNDNTGIPLEIVEDPTIGIMALKKKVINSISKRKIYEEMTEEPLHYQVKKTPIESSLKHKLEASSKISLPLLSPSQSLSFHPLLSKEMIMSTKDLNQKEKLNKNQQEKDSPLILSIQPMLGDSFNVVIPSSKHGTVYDLKDVLSMKFGIPIKRIQLLESRKGIFLSPDDAFLIGDFGLENMQTIRFSLKITCGIESPTFVEIYDSEDEEEYLNIRSSFDDDIPLSPLENEDDNDDDLKDILSLLHVKSDDQTTLTDIQKLDQEEQGQTLELDQSSISYPSLSSPITGPSTCYKCGRHIRIAQRFECKCRHTFCPLHRFYDDHHCILGHKQRKESPPPSDKYEKSQIDSF